ncbi:hypothetical protein CRG98_009138 [Punica granatum]|uniref:Uncharacterized protein n=1 Tax=Punica granatum TaxID=22663 RepID=A0A2I0KPP8_PUNGR|nr:hypothetical protein CRG98_009138 [Punica granatum]
MHFIFESPGRPVESFYFGVANGGPAFRGPDARPPGLLLALHGHIETFSKVPKGLYRLFDTPVAPRGFRPSRLDSFEFARAKGSNNSTSECVTFCLRRGVASAAPPLSRSIDFFFELAVPEFYISAVPCFVHWRRKKMQNCHRECVTEVVLMLAVEDAHGYVACRGRIVASFNRGCPSWRVGRDHSPVGDVTVLVTFAAGGQGHALLVGAVACDLLRREGWDSLVLLGWLALELLIVSPWRKGENHERSTCKGGHNFVYRVADSMDCCRSRVEGLHGGITRCMVRCYRDCAIYEWGLSTQGCEFLEIERGSLGVGSVAQPTRFVPLLGTSD